MSDSSTGENGKESSEMQRVTLLLHMMEHMVLPEAILTREIKSSAIAFAKDMRIGGGGVGHLPSSALALAARSIDPESTEYREPRVVMSNFKTSTGFCIFSEEREAASPHNSQPKSV